MRQVWTVKPHGQAWSTTCFPSQTVLHDNFCANNASVTYLVILFGLSNLKCSTGNFTSPSSRAGRSGELNLIHKANVTFNLMRPSIFNRVDLYLVRRPTQFPLENLPRPCPHRSSKQFLCPRKIVHLWRNSRPLYRKQHRDKSHLRTCSRSFFLHLYHIVIANLFNP